MWQIVWRALAAGFIVAVLTEIASRWGRAGALAMTIPLVPATVLLMMYWKGDDPAAISRLARDMVILIVLWLPIFIPLALAQRAQIGFWIAAAMGTGVALAGVGTYLWITR